MRKSSGPRAVSVTARRRATERRVAGCESEMSKVGSAAPTRARCQCAMALWIVRRHFIQTHA
eukprot:4810402-Prymnesium_polylepis.2